MSPKHVTMDQIAREAGVSRTTVSFVLNNTPNKNIPEATRQRVLEAAQRLGYYESFPVDQKLIAFVMHQTSEQIAQDALLGEVLRGLSGAIEPHGYHVGLFSMPLDSPTHYLDLVMTRRPQGIVLSGPIIKDSEELRVLQERGIPTVIQGQVENPEIYCVDVDNVHGAYIAVRHLLELDHRRIAMITNSPSLYTASEERLRGYRRALAEYGVEEDERLVRYGAFTSASGYAAMQEILSAAGEPPSAVFAASDVVALGAIQAIRQAGLQIPDDISLVGFDDIPLAPFLSPPLTTVRIFAADLGRHAGQVLMGLILGQGNQPRRIFLDSLLKIRESTRHYQG
ncbi:MAG: LacI family DNA-binding transcriptional regulator [Chloroflexi bacterium]|nr:LacI family DNA-binding transcriptional regulator [Chloroflexota bacterium]